MAHKRAWVSHNGGAGGTRQRARDCRWLAGSSMPCLPSNRNSATSQRRSTPCVSAVARAWMLSPGRKGSSPEVSTAVNLRQAVGSHQQQLVGCTAAAWTCGAGVAAAAADSGYNCCWLTSDCKEAAASSRLRSARLATPSL